MNKLACAVDSGAAETISLDDILRDITEAKKQVDIICEDMIFMVCERGAYNYAIPP